MVGVLVPECSERWSRCLRYLSRGLTQTRNVLFSCCTVILLTLLIAPCHLAQAQEGWRDDFELYDLGAFPSAHWSPSGNGDVGGRVEEESGIKVLKLRGSGTANCWEALAHRTIEGPNTAFTVEFDV